jgi:hypothetical protein
VVHLLRILGALSILVGFSACANSTVPHGSAHGVEATRPLWGVSVAPFTDQREERPRHLGAFRHREGGRSRPLKAAVPISQWVASAFTKGLKARGLSASANGAFVLKGEIHEFSCDQTPPAVADVEVTIRLLRLSTGEEVFMRRYPAHRIESSRRQGKLSSAWELRQLASHTLQMVVDEALNDPEFQRQLH